MQFTPYQKPDLADPPGMNIVTDVERREMRERRMKELTTPGPGKVRIDPELLAQHFFRNGDDMETAAAKAAAWNEQGLPMYVKETGFFEAVKGLWDNMSLEGWGKILEDTGKINEWGPGLYDLANDIAALPFAGIERGMNRLATALGGKDLDPAFELSTLRGVWNYFGMLIPLERGTFSPLQPSAAKWEILKRYMKERPHDFLSDLSIITPLAKKGAATAAARSTRAATVMNKLKFAGYLVEIGMDPGSLVEHVPRGTRKITDTFVPDTVERSPKTQQMIRQNDAMQQLLPSDERIQMPKVIMEEGPRRKQMAGMAYKVSPLGIARKAIDKAQDQFDKIYESVISTKSGDRPEQFQLGEQVDNAFKSKTLELQQGLNKRYESILEPGFIKSPGKADNAIAVMEEYLQKWGNTGESKGDPSVAQIRERLEEYTKARDAGKIDIEWLLNTRSQLLKKVREQSPTGQTIVPPDVAVRNRLAEALTDDMIESGIAADPAKTTQLRQLQTDYATEMSLTNSKMVQMLVRASENGDYAGVAKRLGRDAYVLNAYFPAFLERVGPEAAGAIKANYLMEMKKRVTRATEAGVGEEIFTWHALSRELKRHKESVELLYQPNEVEALYALADTLSNNETIQKAIGGSQTAANQVALSAIRYGGPVYAAIDTLGDLLANPDAALIRGAQWSAAAAFSFGAEAYIALRETPQGKVLDMLPYKEAMKYLEEGLKPVPQAKRLGTGAVRQEGLNE